MGDLLDVRVQLIKVTREKQLAETALYEILARLDELLVELDEPEVSMVQEIIYEYGEDGVENT